jgi:hypothetical protein
LGEVGGFRGRSGWRGTVKGRRMEVGDAARHAGAEPAAGGDRGRSAMVAGAREVTLEVGRARKKIP